MTPLLADLKKFDDDVHKTAREYLDMQITCMILHHAGCVRISEGHIRNGNIIIASVKRMRVALDALYKAFTQALGEEETKNIFTKAPYDKLLYTSVSDEIILSNSHYFTIAPRPKDASYMCDETACQIHMETELQKYFSSLWE